MPGGSGVNVLVRSCSRAALALSLLAALPAGAQDVTGRERRLADIHALLLDLPPIEAPGALDPGRLDLGVEVTAIPVIDGDVGPKREITASGSRPPLPATAAGAGPAGATPLPRLRGRGLHPPGRDRPDQRQLAGGGGRDRLGERAAAPGAARTLGDGPCAERCQRARRARSAERHRGRLDVGAGYELRLGKLSLTPYAGVGQVWSTGDFRSSVDGGTVHSSHAGAVFDGGARVLYRDRWEGVLEYSAYPGRLWNPRFRLGYVVSLGG